MRAIALHSDVLVATSAIWQTNCVVVRNGEEAFVIDSPILPDELEALTALVAQARFASPNGLLATHGDWDHLLGRLAFPELALGCAESTLARLRSAPGEAQRELRAFDDGLLIGRPRPLSLGAVQELPVPGRCAIGESELELHPAAGHTADGMAIWIPWAATLVVGDYLSPVEIPALADHDGERDTYLETLERLRALMPVASHVVPGHGPVIDGARALALLEEDVAYLLALGSVGARAELPAGRRSPAQARMHERNLARLAS